MGANGQELERLKEFGITKQQIIDQAQKMGMNEIVNAKGQITDQKKFNESLFALMRDRYKGGMEIQSQSFLGMISNAKDSMGQMLQIMGQPLFEKMKSGLTQIVPIMSAAVSAVKGDWQGVKDQLNAAFGPDTALKIENVFLGIGAFVNKAKQAIMGLQPAWDNIKRIGIALIPLFTTAGKMIAGAWLIVTKALTPVINFLTDIAARIVEWQGFVPLIIGVASAFAAFQAITKVIAIFNSLRTMIMNVRIAMLLLNASFLANPITWIVALIVGLIAALVALYMKNETFRNAVQAAWAGIKAAFESVINWATTTIPVWWENIKTWFMTGVNFIMQIIQPFVTFFVNTWNNMKLLVLGIVEVFIGLLTGNFDKMKLGLLAIWTAIKDQALNYWQLLKDTVLKLVSSVATGISNGFQNAKDWAVSKVKALYDGVVNWVKSIPGKFTEMKNNVIREVKSIDLVQIGKNIIQGLINGIGSMASAVGRKAREIAGSVEDAIKKRLGIKSPSRVMIEVGTDTGSGFIVGLDDMIQAAIAKARELGGSVADAVSSGPQPSFANLQAVGRSIGQVSGVGSLLSGSGGGVVEQHIHYWQINADEISDVSRLLDVVNGVVQSVRSR